MKGLIQGLLAVMIVGFAIILVAYLSIRFSIVRNIDVQYRFDASQATLLTLLSITKQDPVIEILGEKISGLNVGTSFLQTVLEKIVPSKCFSLSAGTITLANKDSCGPEFRAFTKIPLPYSPSKLVETVTVVIK